MWLIPELWVFLQKCTQYWMAHLMKGGLPPPRASFTGSPQSKSNAVVMGCLTVSVRYSVGITLSHHIFGSWTTASSQHAGTRSISKAAIDQGNAHNWSLLQLLGQQSQTFWQQAEAAGVGAAGSCLHIITPLLAWPKQAAAAVSPWAPNEDPWDETSLNVFSWICSPSQALLVRRD